MLVKLVPTSGTSFMIKKSPLKAVLKGKPEECCSMTKERITNYSLPKPNLTEGTQIKPSQIRTFILSGAPAESEIE